MFNRFKFDVFATSKTLFVLPAILLISACGGGGDGGNTPPPTAKSSDKVYTNATLMSSNINHPTAFDAGGHVSSNYLEFYFFSDRPGGQGGMDIYVSTRTDIADPWGPASNVAAINSAGDDRQVALSTDGLSMIFNSDTAGGFGEYDLYMSTRASLADAWSAPVNLGSVINSASNDGGPSISDDGLSLYFHSSRPGGLGQSDIYVSTRASNLDPGAHQRD